MATYKYIRQLPFDVAGLPYRYRDGQDAKHDGPLFYKQGADPRGVAGTWDHTAGQLDSLSLTAHKSGEAAEDGRYAMDFIQQ